MGIIALILVSVLLNCAAQLCMKNGMIAVGEITGGLAGALTALPSMVTNISLWISAFCYIVSIGLWLVVLSKVDVSFAYPFLSIVYVISAVVGYFALHDAVTPVRIAGISVL